MDVNWAPTDRISFSTGYVHESNFQKQRSSVRNPYESFTKHDWQTDTLTPFLGPSVGGTPIFLGADHKNYWTGRRSSASPSSTSSSRPGSPGRVVRARPGFPELLMPHWGIDVPRRSPPPVPAGP